MAHQQQILISPPHTGLAFAPHLILCEAKPGIAVSVAEARKRFIATRVAEQLADHATVRIILQEALEDRGEAVAKGIVQAMKEAGQCWDGVSDLSDILHHSARLRASAEWEAPIDPAPESCASCNNGKREIDPCGTGDSPATYNCRLNTCPWGIA